MCICTPQFLERDHCGQGACVPPDELRARAENRTYTVDAYCQNCGKWEKQRRITKGVPVAAVKCANCDIAALVANP